MCKTTGKHNMTPKMFLSPFRLLNITLFCLLSFGISVQAQDTNKQTLQDGTQAHPYQLGWSHLIPEGYEPEKLLEKYEKDLMKLESLPDDSEEGLQIIQRIQSEIDMIPTNTKWDGKWVSLPGFIAPLETKNAAVGRFLLVPYFGACIHVPPPPVNQTVLVDLKPKQGIKLHEVDYPFMITGKLSVSKTNTDIGNAGYHITEATAVVHHDSRWLEEE